MLLAVAAHDQYAIKKNGRISLISNHGYCFDSETVQETYDSSTAEDVKRKKKIPI